jgi:hypothetical protein
MSNFIEFINELFENDYDTISDSQFDLDLVSVEEFKTVVVQVKEEKGWSDKINIPMWKISKGMYRNIIHKLVEVKQDLGKDFSEFLSDNFMIEGKVSVWGGDDWAARVFPNGSIFFRNHHRVIGTDAKAEAIIYEDNSRVLQDMNKVAKFVEENDDLSSHYDYSVIDNNKDGILWTSKQLENISDYGQTIVYISTNVLEALENDEEFEDNFFNNSDIINTAHNSRGGSAVCKVYKNIVKVHSMYRADDNLDTIAEEYSIYLGESPDEDDYRTQAPATSYSDLNKTLKERTIEHFENTYYSEYDEAIEGLENIEEFTKDFKEAFCDDMKRFITNSITWVPKDVSSHWDSPIGYGSEVMRYRQKTLENNGNLFVINTSYSAEDDFSEIKDNFESLVDSIKNDIYGVSKIYLNTSNETSFYNNENEGAEDKALVELGSDEYNSQIESMVQKLSDMHEEAYGQEDDKEPISDWLRYEAEMRFDIVVVLDNTLDAQELNHFMKQKTQEFDNGMYLLIPMIGVGQGYDCGDFDTGNIENYFTFEEDDYDDEDYYDDDYDEGVELTLDKVPNN